MPHVGNPRIAERADQDRVEVVTQHRVTVRRYRDPALKVVSAPQGSISISIELPVTWATALRALTASVVTSLPIPSPEITAIRTTNKS